MAERLLGIDIGTTGVRAAVFEPTGELLAEGRISLAYETPRPGWAEIAPETWWAAVRGALALLAGRAALDGVAAVGVVGQAPTLVLLDRAGAPIRPAILWLDTRATEAARDLGSRPYYLGPKLAWVAKHEPEALERARYVVPSHGYIVERLTGEVVEDPSTAALAAPLFDAASQSWSERACAAAGVPPDLLPRIRRADAIAGRVTGEAAAATGLRAGTPVAVGGGDFAAATLAAGVLHEGEACLMLGTAGNLLIPRRALGTDARLINTHHVAGAPFLSLGGTLSGGAQEWLRHAMTRGTTLEDDTAVRGALPSFDALDGEASAVPAGSGGLLFLPYLQGERTPVWDVDARGAYVGLDLQHGRGHLWRALLEGVALSFVDCQSVVEEDGVVLAEVVAANGGGKSALFRQILCDALGVPLAYAPRAGGTVLGAAILACLCAGVVDDATQTRGMRGELIGHEPHRPTTARLREMLEVRRGLYESLRPTFARVAR